MSVCLSFSTAVSLADGDRAGFRDPQRTQASVRADTNEIVAVAPVRQSKRRTSLGAATARKRPSGDQVYARAVRGMSTGYPPGRKPGASDAVPVAGSRYHAACPSGAIPTSLNGPDSPGRTLMLAEPDV